VVQGSWSQVSACSTDDGASSRSGRVGGLGHETPRPLDSLVQLRSIAQESESLPAYDHTKQDFLSWWGNADILVDDSRATIEAARKAGLHVVLVPQPWNQASGSLSDSLDTLAMLA
jgi:hypothetical protein